MNTAVTTKSPKGATINARVNKALKTRAEKVLARVGVRTSDLITMTLHQVVLQDGIPFDVKVPNKETREAIDELESGGGEKFYGTAQELGEHILNPLKR